MKLKNYKMFTTWCTRSSGVTRMGHEKLRNVALTASHVLIAGIRLATIFPHIILVYTNANGKRSLEQIIYSDSFWKSYILFYY